MREYFTCPCCGYITLESEHEYDICPICFGKMIGFNLKK